MNGRVAEPGRKQQEGGQRRRKYTRRSAHRPFIGAAAGAHDARSRESQQTVTLIWLVEALSQLFLVARTT